MPSEVDVSTKRWVVIAVVIALVARQKLRQADEAVGR